MKQSTYIFALLTGVCTTPLFAQIPNAGFENWDSLTLVNNIRIYNPAEWSSSNIELINLSAPQTVEMTTDAHSGNYAVKLTSAINDEERRATFLGSGYNIGDGPQDPNAQKFPLQGRINGFEGYYKYAPHHEDSFQVFLALYKDGIYLGQAFMRVATPTNEYTKFWHPVIFPASMTPPDSAMFIIEPSIVDDSEGSVLFIDDLNITYGFTMGTSEITNQPKITLFPNPASDGMKLLGYNPKRHYSYRLSGIDGKMIGSGSLTDDTLSIGFLDSGVYVLSLTDDEGRTSNHKFIKQ